MGYGDIFRSRGKSNKGEGRRIMDEIESCFVQNVHRLELREMGSRRCWICPDIRMLVMS